jgi:hypothetical protein
MGSTVLPGWPRVDLFGALLRLCRFSVSTDLSSTAEYVAERPEIGGPGDYTNPSNFQAVDWFSVYTNGQSLTSLGPDPINLYENGIYGGDLLVNAFLVSSSLTFQINRDNCN